MTRVHGLRLAPPPEASPPRAGGLPRLRVGLFLPTLDGGGAERALLTVGRLLAGQGHRVDLVVGQARGALRGELPAGVDLVDLGHAHVRAALGDLVGYLRRRRPDCLIATLPPACVLAVAAARVAGTGTPVVARVANAMSATAARRGGWNQRLTALAAGPAYRRAAAVIAPSSDLAADTVRCLGLPPGAVRTVTNPVIGPALRRGAAQDLHHPWFAPWAPPVVLAVGRLIGQKNLLGLLDAFARVRRDRRVRLLVLGEGPQRAELQQRIGALDLTADVALPGFDPNPYRYLARCAVYVLSSHHEGLPATLIQALACGAKVVATDCPTGPREILHGGALGRLVPPADPAALAGAITEALDAPPRPVPPAALEPYTEERALRAYSDLLADVCAPAARRRVQVGA